jgi:hypothetical protein
VWRFERRRDLLRVARDGVAYWQRVASGWLQRQEQPMQTAAAFDADSLRSATAALMHRVGAVRGRIDVVIESAWLPVLPIEPGAELFSSAAVEALLRHRVQEVFGAPTAGAEWQLRTVHRAGERSGLGFALSLAVRGALVEALADAGCTAGSLQPAVVWAARQDRSRGLPNGWWLWLEYDRTIALWRQHGRVAAINPAAAPARTWAEVGRRVAVESVRLGVDGTIAPGVVSGWSAAPAQSGLTGWSWRSVGPSSTAADASALQIGGASS